MQNFSIQRSTISSQKVLSEKPAHATAASASASSSPVESNLKKSLKSRGQASINQNAGSTQGLKKAEKLDIAGASAREKEAKKQRLAAASARMKVKKQAFRKESLIEQYGVETDVERRALVNGFLTKDKNSDATVDVTGYNKYMKEQAARNFTRADGSHPFQEADGSGNVQKYSNYQYRKYRQSQHEEDKQHLL